MYEEKICSLPINILFLKQEMFFAFLWKSKLYISDLINTSSQFISYYDKISPIFTSQNASDHFGNIVFCICICAFLKQQKYQASI